MGLGSNLSPGPMTSTSKTQGSIFSIGLGWQTQAQSHHGLNQARHQTKAPSQPKASLSIRAASSGEASTNNDVEERGRDGGTETVGMHGFRSHGAGRWTSPLMAPSTTLPEQSKRTASRPPSTAWREAPRTEVAALNPKNRSDEVCEEWKACLAVAHFPATEEDSRAWRCG